MHKILIAIHSLNVGGMEKVASVLANRFAEKNNIDVHIILFGIKRDVFYKIDPNISIHKPNFIFDNKIRTLSTLKTLFFLRKKIKSLNPDTILSFGEYWNNLILLSTLGLNLPIFIADRSTPMKDLGKIQNILRKLLYPRSMGLIVQTEKASEVYKRQFKNLRIHVIANPISQANDKRKLRRENIILSVGRLIQTKHFDRLIKIYSRLEKSDWKLVIVGENSKKQLTREKLEKIVKDLHLVNRVIFAGNQKKVIDYYLKSKIFAFTSSSEGFPNVIGEAMSAGLPVIAYDCVAGPSEIITDGEDGFIIPLFDDELFKKKLSNLMSNEKLRSKMGLKAVLKSKQFDTNLIAEQFLKVILN